MQAFFAHDPIIEQDPKVKAELVKMHQDLHLAGYEPDFSVVGDKDFSGRLLSEEEMTWSLCTHSERIALAMAFAYGNPNEPIRMEKNLRICPDCHEATKILSKIYNREIHMGDANRNHRFKDGKCSCNDFYWWHIMKSLPNPEYNIFIAT